MTEQLRSPIARHDDAPDTLGRLRSAIDALISSPASSTAAVNTLNGLLRTKSLESADGAERGVLLVKLLGEPLVRRAVDDSGVSTRALAVGALLELGYPWALQVHPDDLAFFRKTQKPAFRFRRFALASVAIGALLGTFGYLANRSPALDVGGVGPRALGQCLGSEPSEERYERYVEGARERMSNAAIERTLLELAQPGVHDPMRTKLLCNLIIQPPRWDIVRPGTPVD